MRTFKCLLLCVGHLAVFLSISLLPDIRDYFDNPVVDIILSCFFAVFLFWIGAYIVLMPLLRCTKYNTRIAHIFATGAIVVYTICLSLLFVFIAHVIPAHFLQELSVLAGNVGLGFALLVVYDNMRGAPIKDTYNELMYQLEAIELSTNSTSCGLEDDDVQRGAISGLPPL